MPKLNKKKIVPYFLVVSVLFLTSCSSYTGLRTPHYDGKPIKSNESAIEIYRTTAEVTGVEKDFYIRYPFSEDMLQKSLDYPDEAPFLLKEGRYIIGEDLPAGRATLLGNKSSFSTENYDVHVGNLMVRDVMGEVYFENLFHSEYGQLTTQFDLIPGHEIIIVGKESEVTVFYEERLPTDPYALMDLPELIKNIEHIEVQQPQELFNDGRIVHLTAGIFEVGVHLEAGEYVLSEIEAPHNTEMYIFGESLNPRVIELLIDSDSKEKKAKVKLAAGEKIYLNLVKKLELIRLDE